MGIAIGAGALLVGGKTIEVFLGLCFCIDVFVAGGLAILGGKIYTDRMRVRKTKTNLLIMKLLEEMRNYLWTTFPF